jgi:hypothetical protein
MQARSIGTCLLSLSRCSNSNTTRKGNMRKGWGVGMMTLAIQGGIIGGVSQMPLLCLCQNVTLLCTKVLHP